MKLGKYLDQEYFYAKKRVNFSLKIQLLFQIAAIVSAFILHRNLFSGDSKIIFIYPMIYGHLAWLLLESLRIMCILCDSMSCVCDPKEGVIGACLLIFMMLSYVFFIVIDYIYVFRFWGEDQLIEVFLIFLVSMHVR